MNAYVNVLTGFHICRVFPFLYVCTNLGVYIYEGGSKVSEISLVKSLEFARFRLRTRGLQGARGAAQSKPVNEKPTAAFGRAAPGF